MIASRRLQLMILIAGDLVLFYAALIATLTIRELSFPSGPNWSIHKWPFFFIQIIWLIIFYIAGLYEIKNLGSRKIIFKNVLTTMLAGGIVAILTFYLVPSFKITPKTNLLIDILFVTILIFLWRQLFWHLTLKTNKIKILFFGKTKEADELVKHLKQFPQLGYEPSVLIPDSSSEINIGAENDANDELKNTKIERNLINVTKEYGIKLIVASKEILENQNAAKRFYEVLPLGVSIMNFPDFYEFILGKIPVSNIRESWFLENLVEINKNIYEILKRIFDVIFAVLLGIPAAAALLPIGALIKLSGRGPVFIFQTRIGKNGKIFRLAKYRTMVALTKDGLAETNGAKWAELNDPRITGIGKILRKTRIDELPQLWNILKGEMSFIGPRPERPEFVEELEKQIPYYQMRHLIKPGVSGWAQINFPYGASVEDAMEKLQYDLYYIKNRSFIIDLIIILRTTVTIVKSGGR